jgi:hypothetical protein
VTPGPLGDYSGNSCCLPSNMPRLKPLLVARDPADAAPAEKFVEITLRLTDPRHEATNCIGGSKNYWSTPPVDWARRSAETWPSESILSTSKREKVASNRLDLANSKIGGDARSTAKHPAFSGRESLKPARKAPTCWVGQRARRPLGPSPWYIFRSFRVLSPAYLALEIEPIGMGQKVFVGDPQKPRVQERLPPASPPEREPRPTSSLLPSHGGRWQRWRGPRIRFASQADRLGVSDGSRRQPHHQRGDDHHSR